MLNAWIRKWKYMQHHGCTGEFDYLRATCRHPINPRNTTTSWPIWVIEHRFVVRRSFFVTQTAITIGWKFQLNLSNLSNHRNKGSTSKKMECDRQQFIVSQLFTISILFSIFIVALHPKNPIYFTFIDARNVSVCLHHRFTTLFRYFFVWL